MFTNCKVFFTYNGKHRVGYVKSDRVIKSRRLLTVHLNSGEHKSFYLDECANFDYIDAPKDSYKGSGEPYDAWKDSKLTG